MPLFTDDWLGSTSILLMTPAEEAGYLRLLCHQWNAENCDLPDNDKELETLSRLGKAWRNGSGAKIRQNFLIKGDRIYNLRTLEIWQEQKDFRDKKAEAGRKGADARWHT
jgi:uncharacterized protein YdaU (DUF1376 family)